VKKFLLLGAVLLSTACANEAKPAVAPEPPAAAAVAPVEATPEKPEKKKHLEGPGGFPLPADGESKGEAPGGGGKIVVYEFPRGRDEVAAELEALVKSEGFTVDGNDKSPKGSIRMTMSKDGKTFKASVAGDATRSAIIITLP
jgi:hypothetical protein